MTNEALTMLKLHELRKTSHILHLLLSIITLGIWLPIWVLVHANNISRNQTIEDEVRRMSGQPPTHRGLLSSVVRAVFFLVVLAVTGVFALNALSVLGRL